MEACGAVLRSAAWRRTFNGSWGHGSSRGLTGPVYVAITGPDGESEVAMEVFEIPSFASSFFFSFCDGVV